MMPPVFHERRILSTEAIPSAPENTKSRSSSWAIKPLCLGDSRLSLGGEGYFCIFSWILHVQHMLKNAACSYWGKSKYGGTLHSCGKPPQIRLCMINTEFNSSLGQKIPPLDGSCVFLIVDPSQTYMCLSAATTKALIRTVWVVVFSFTVQFSKQRKMMKKESIFLAFFNNDLQNQIR